MKIRGFDFVLLVVILVGGVLAWRTGRERGRLWETYRRLSQKTGDLADGDPAKVHVQALKTGDPMHFAWRVYLPPNYRQNLKSNLGGSSSSWSSQSREFIARVRFREDERGHILVYTQFHGGSSSGGFGDDALTGLLHGRWDRLRVGQLGLGEVATIDPDKPAVLLRLSMPEEMQAEARRKLPPYIQKTHVPTLYELELDPEKTSKP